MREAWLQVVRGGSLAPLIPAVSSEGDPCRRKPPTLSMIEAQFPSPGLGEDYLCLQAPDHIFFRHKHSLQLVDVVCFEVEFLPERK
jgi:hypothetical protein